jgi:hypothetical protein
MTILFALIPVLQMPPPPGTESSGDGADLWRIGGVFMITVVTVGIFAWLFRPTDGAAHVESADGDLATAQGPSLGSANVVPFREPNREDRARANEFTAAAASERLRRLTSSAAPSTPTSLPGRRRLGARRTWIPESESPSPSFAPSPTPTDAPEQSTQSATGEESIVDYTAIPETSLPPIGVTTVGPPSGEELLGDLVGRLPSQEDQDVILPYKTMTGEHPTESDLENIGGGTVEPGKIVQFVPRSNKGTEQPLDEDYQILEEFLNQNAPTRLPVDPATRQSITATVQELLFCANVGEFMHGFALYTDRYLFQFMTESGFNEQTFRETFTHMPGKEPQDWTRIERIDNVTRQDDGRITADVVYLEHGQTTAPERFTFKLDNITRRWLIDGIAPV